MKYERATPRESLEGGIARVAAAYGFSAPPINVSKRAVGDTGITDVGTAAQSILLSTHPTKKPTQVWGVHKQRGGILLSFTVLASRHAISHALVVKTAASIAELAGFTDLVVGVSSIGDNESRRRFIRELGSYFRRHGEHIPEETMKRSAREPLEAYREILSLGGELVEKLPKPIDFLSENSRKIMVDTLHLFEAVGIEYELVPHLPSVTGVHGELLFAISGKDGTDERVILATGGRLDELVRTKDKAPVGHAVGLSLTVPADEVGEREGGISCAVVHVGEVARQRAFSLIEALWRADVAVQDALLAESLREQMDEAKRVEAKYIAIIGQRESLDKTVLVRNSQTGMQESMPADRLAAFVSRNRSLRS